MDKDQAIQTLQMIFIKYVERKDITFQDMTDGMTAHYTLNRLREEKARVSMEQAEEKKEKPKDLR